MRNTSSVAEADAARIVDTGADASAKYLENAREHIDAANERIAGATTDTGNSQERTVRDLLSAARNCISMAERLYGKEIASLKRRQPVADASSERSPTVGTAVSSNFDKKNGNKPFASRRTSSPAKNRSALTKFNWFSGEDSRYRFSRLRNLRRLPKDMELVEEGGENLPAKAVLDIFRDAVHYADPGRDVSDSHVAAGCLDDLCISLVGKKWADIRNDERDKVVRLLIYHRDADSGRSDETAEPAVLVAEEFGETFSETETTETRSARHAERHTG